MYPIKMPEYPKETSKADMLRHENLFTDMCFYLYLAPIKCQVGAARIQPIVGHIFLTPVFLFIYFFFID